MVLFVGQDGSYIAMAMLAGYLARSAAARVARAAIGAACQQQRNDGEVARPRRVMQRRAVGRVRYAGVEALDVDAAVEQQRGGGHGAFACGVVERPCVVQLRAVVEQQLHLIDVAPAGDKLEDGGRRAPGAVVGIGAVLEQPLDQLR